MPALRAAGIQLRCITAQGPDSAWIRAKLQSYDGVSINNLVIISDVGHKTLALGPASVARPTAADVGGGVRAGGRGGSEHALPFFATQLMDKYVAAYSMIQPALVVLDNELKVTTSWSWNVSGYVAGQKVESLTNDDAAPHNTPLKKPTNVVTIRPATSDIIAAISEGRSIGLESVMYF